MSLDIDDPRPPYQQVAARLRAGILTGKFPPGQRLPSQVELSETYGVARMTIQRALRILKDGGLIAARQGGGTFVRERTAGPPIGPTPHTEQVGSPRFVEIRNNPGTSAGWALHVNRFPGGQETSRVPSAPAAGGWSGHPAPTTLAIEQIIAADIEEFETDVTRVVHSFGGRDVHLRDGSRVEYRWRLVTSD